MKIEDARVQIQDVANFLDTFAGPDALRFQNSLRFVDGWLATLSEYGLVQGDYLKLNEYLETKIRGLAGSAGDEALKFVDSGDDAHRLMAKKYQAEETALREVLRELQDRRDATLRAVAP